MWSNLVRSSPLSAILLVGASAAFVPARFQGGALPENQVVAVSGGEVLLEAEIDPNGNVSGTRTLRMTPPFTDPVRKAVGSWHFAPALEQSDSVPGSVGDPAKRVSSKVLVAAMFRPPTLNTPTLGEPPRDVAPPSNEIPYPTTTVMPLFPPRAVFSGVILVEVRVGLDGRVEESKVIRPAPPFDEAALEAVRHWTFRAARVHGIPTASFAYIVFGFRQPVT